MLCACEESHIPHEDGNRCVPKAECARVFLDGEEFICLAAETCTGRFKQALDDLQRCVENCPSWVAVENEQHCVEECPAELKFRNALGRCVASLPEEEQINDECANENNSKNKNSWLIPTIVVPVALAACAAGVGIGMVCELRRKSKGRTSSEKSIKNQKRPELKLVPLTGSRASARTPVKPDVEAPSHEENIKP